MGVERVLSGREQSYQSVVNESKRRSVEKVMGVRMRVKERKESECRKVLMTGGEVMEKREYSREEGRKDPGDCAFSDNWEPCCVGQGRAEQCNVM